MWHQVHVVTIVSQGTSGSQEVEREGKIWKGSETGGLEGREGL